MRKQQFNVRISPRFINFVNQVIKNEQKKGFVVSQADVIEDALKMYYAYYRDNQLDNDPLDLEGNE